MAVEVVAPAIKRTANVSSVAKTAKVSSMEEARTEAIAGLGQIAQIPLLALKQYADVGALTVYWPKISSEIAKLAETQEQIAQIVDPLIKVGPYTALITATLPFVMQVAVNHGVMSPGAMGTVPASTLSVQVETQMAQQELEALKLQLQAEKAANAMRDEINDSRRAMADAMRDVQVEATGD